MRLSRPSRNVFFISVIVAIVALLVSTGTLSLGISAFALLGIAYIVLLLGVLLTGF